MISSNRFIKNIFYYFDYLQFLIWYKIKHKGEIKMKQKYKQLLSLILLLTFTLLGCGTLNTEEPNSFPTSAAQPANQSETDENIITQTPSYSTLNVHFIDVGQGDSTLLESNGHYMLIDAGENDKGKIVSSYLREQGVETLDYVIGTHPHSDHIGGLDIVIKDFNVEKVILPEKEHTTKTFEDVIDAVSEKGLKITKAVTGDTYTFGDASFTILAPNADYKDDLNNWSVGVKVTNGSNSFVFTGDAEAAAELDICKTGIDLSADVFQAGHHGSSTSNTEELIKAINPAYVVVSCGKNNQYGHPHKEFVDRMKEFEIQYFRTDEEGTIIAESNGSVITWNVDTKEVHTAQNLSASTIEITPTINLTSTPKPTPTVEPTSTPEPTPTQKVSITVHITKTGEKYHAAGCQYLRKSDISISLDDAKLRGYTACSKCHPPK